MEEVSWQNKMRVIWIKWGLIVSLFNPLVDVTLFYIVLGWWSRRDEQNQRNVKKHYGGGGLLYKCGGFILVMTFLHLPFPNIPTWTTPSALSFPLLKHPSFLGSNFIRFTPPKILFGIKRRSCVLVISQSSPPPPCSPSILYKHVRFRLHNLGPQPGSTKKRKRKGRGDAAGQGNSCGFGMKGQKARSGPGVGINFEGGQTPLFRRLPKLRGTGMRRGVLKHVIINLKDLEKSRLRDGDEVSLLTLREKRILKPTGRKKRLPLKILGHGEISKKLIVKAGAFSSSARQKLEAAGCTLTVLGGPKKWMRPAVARNLARAIEFYAKKRAERIAATAAAATTEPLAAAATSEPVEPEA